MIRLRSDFWVAAYLRRCAVEGIPAALRRRGAAEAGAIFVKVDHLNGEASLYGPVPQSLIETDDVDRKFIAVLTRIPSMDVEDKIARELRFDADLWLVEIDMREDRHLLSLSCDKNT